MSERVTMFDLDGEAIAVLGREAVAKAKQASFARGVPVAYEDENGVPVKEYPDGRIERLATDGVRRHAKRVLAK